VPPNPRAQSPGVFCLHAVATLRMIFDHPGSLRCRRRAKLLATPYRPTGEVPRSRLLKQIRSSKTDFPSIQGGLPHSEIHGSKLIRSSPRLFAAYHVLHRLCMPRHPPNALTTLNRSHCQCSSFVWFSKPILLACARRGAEPGHTDNLAIAAPGCSCLTIKAGTNGYGYLLQPHHQ
jgi:hypothetical protein